MTKLEKHTPGPWALLPQNGAGPMLVYLYETGNQMNPTGYRLIAHMLQRGNSLEQDRANHHLIAAAPDMLAMLRSLHKTIASMGGDLEVTAPESLNANTYRDDLRRINALIAKAEGR